MLAVAEKEVSCFGSSFLCHCYQGLVHSAVHQTPFCTCALLHRLCYHLLFFTWKLPVSCSFHSVVRTHWKYTLRFLTPNPNLCLSCYSRGTNPSRVHRRVMVIPRSGEQSHQDWIQHHCLLSRGKRSLVSQAVKKISTCGLHRSKTQPSNPLWVTVFIINFAL